MHFQLIITPQALKVLEGLDRNDPHRAARVRSAFAKMQMDIKSKGLATHEYSSVTGPNKEKVFEAYVENHTPNAYRIIWYYGPERGQITVITVIPHPD